MFLTYPAITPNFIKSIDLPDFKHFSYTWNNLAYIQKRTQFINSSVILNIEYQYLNENNSNAIVIFYNNIQGSAFFLPANFTILFPDDVKNFMADWGISKWIFQKDFIVNPQIMRKNLKTNVRICKYNLTFKLQSVLS